MTKVSLKLYKIALCFLVFLSIVLIYFDISLLRNYTTIQNNENSSITVISLKPEIKIERFGYSDALAQLRRDKKIKLLNISETYDKTNIIKVDAEYQGDIKSFYDSLINLKENKNFYTIENISAMIENENSTKVSFSILYYRTN